MEIVHEGTVNSMQRLLGKVREGVVKEEDVKEVLLKNKIVRILTQAGFNKLEFSFAEPSVLEVKAKKDPNIKEVKVETTGI